MIRADINDEYTVELHRMTCSEREGEDEDDIYKKIYLKYLTLI